MAKGEMRTLNCLAINPEMMKSLRDIVVESIREAIIGGDFKPGDHLKERELAQAMGISTTPIKEALRILGHEGLVETLPRKGTYVSAMVHTSLEEMLFLKASLEALCARLAATKITDEELAELEDQIQLMERLAKAEDTQRLAEENTKYHKMICSAAKNPMIYQMVSNVVAFDNAFRKRALKYPIEVVEGFNEHKKIFDAIKKRDPDLADNTMKAHIIRTAETVLQHKKKRMENES